MLCSLLVMSMSCSCTIVMAVNTFSSITCLLLLRWCLFSAFDKWLPETCIFWLCYAYACLTFHHNGCLVFWLDCVACLLRQNFTLVIGCYPDIFLVFDFLLLPMSSRRFFMLFYRCSLKFSRPYLLLIFAYYCGAWILGHYCFNLMTDFACFLAYVLFDLDQFSWLLYFFTTLSIFSSPAGYRNWSYGL